MSFFPTTARRLCAILAVAASISPALADPLTSAITYQGELQSGGTAVNGNIDVRVTLYNAATGGGAVSGPLLRSGVSVVGGRFTLSDLDFSAAAFGEARWLQIDVRSPSDPGNTAPFTTLSPRQPVTSAPTAVLAQTALTLNGQPATFYTNAANISSGTISDLRLSTNIATNSGVQTFTGSKAFAAAASFNAAGVPFSVASSGLVTNLNADLLDGLSAAAFAPAAHSHDAAAITSGILNDARLSTNVPRIAGANIFSAINSFSSSVGIGTTTPSGRLHVRDATNLPSFLTESSAAPFKVTNGTSGILMDSNQIESVGGALYLNYRGSGNGNDVVIGVGGGRVGIGTENPATPFEVVVAPTQSFQLRQDGFVPGIKVVSEGANAGIMRLRNAVEVWPSDDGVRAGKVDVRNTSGNATISLDGATGNATYANQPAVKSVDASNASVPQTINNSVTLIEEALVTIPGNGFLHITCQASVLVYAIPGGTSTAFLELKETTGAEVLIDENYFGVQGPPFDAGRQQSTITLSHTIPVSAGVRRFKLRVRHAGQGYLSNDDLSPLTRPTITLMYFPRGL